MGKRATKKTANNASERSLIRRQKGLVFLMAEHGLNNTQGRKLNLPPVFRLKAISYMVNLRKAKKDRRDLCSGHSKTGFSAESKHGKYRGSCIRSCSYGYFLYRRCFKPSCRRQSCPRGRSNPFRQNEPPQVQLSCNRGDAEKGSSVGCGPR